MTTSERISILRGAIGSLPPEIGRWVVEVIEASLTGAERIATRNHYLRSAAALVPGSALAKSIRLRDECMVLFRSWERCRDHQPEADTVRGLVHAALRLDPQMPTSLRQLRRIVGRPSDALDIPDLEVSNGSRQ